MATKHCSNCNARVSAGRFFSAVAAATGTFRCAECSHVLKRDISLVTGLFYVVLTAVFLPIGIIFGLSRGPGVNSSTRIQQLFGVGPDAAFLIGIGTIFAMCVSVYAVGFLVFMRLKFDEET